MITVLSFIFLFLIGSFFPICRSLDYETKVKTLSEKEVMIGKHLRSVDNGNLRAKDSKGGIEYILIRATSEAFRHRFYL
jgi:hypothetical protein